MKKNYQLTVLILFIFGFSVTVKAQVGFGTNNPNKSAVVDITSTSKGLLYPRVDLSALTTGSLTTYGLTGATATDGMTVYNTNATAPFSKGFYVWYNNTWNLITTDANAKNIYTADGTLTGNRTLTQAGNDLTFTNTTGNVITNFGSKANSYNTLPGAEMSALNTVSNVTNSVNVFESGTQIGSLGVPGLKSASTTTYADATTSQITSNAVNILDTRTIIDQIANAGQSFLQVGAYTDLGQTNQTADVNFDSGVLGVSDGSISFYASGSVLGFNSFKIKSDHLLSSAYPQTRDDSGTTAPTNFIYTDANGKFLSSPTSLLKLKWYAENALAPTVSPVATGTGSIALGDNAVASADNMFVYGTESGFGAANATQSNFIGGFSGKDASDAYQSNFFGAEAGFEAANANNSNFFGSAAGIKSTDASYSNFFGALAGARASKAYDSNFFGTDAGNNATDANNSNFFGNSAGGGATNANASNFIGYNAGSGAVNANNAIFIGSRAGIADVVDNTLVAGSTSILIGDDTTTGGFSNSIGLGKGATNTASNEFMIGSNAGTLYDIVNPKYPQTRNDSGVTTPINFLYTDANGKFLSAPSNVITGLLTADNGLTKTGNNIQLGGALTGATIVTATATNTLAIAGLQPGATTDNIVLSDPATGVLKILPAATLTNDWHTTGNAGTTAGTNFLGTTDAQDLVFKTNNVENFRIYETAIPTAAKAILSGGDLLIGNITAGKGKSQAPDNTAFGQNSLSNIVFAEPNGNYNTAFGSNTLPALTSGYANTAVGESALSAVTTGTFNAAFGTGALFENNGNQNLAIGSDAMVNNTGGSFNVAIGSSALGNGLTASSNVAIGRQAGQNITGNNNIVIGVTSGTSIGAGTGNVVVGSFGGVANAVNTIVIGDGAGNRRINIDGSGNVGLFGVTAPSAGFHTNGTVRLQGIGTNTIDTKILTADANNNITTRTLASFVADLTVPISSLLAATKINTINNLNFAQTWNWNTLTTENAFSLGTSSLTTGNLFTLNNTSGAAATTGNVALITTNATNNNSKGLRINVTGTGGTDALYIQSASQTGSTMNVNSEVTTGNGMFLATTALTSGNTAYIGNGAVGSIGDVLELNNQLLRGMHLISTLQQL